MAETTQRRWRTFDKEIDRAIEHLQHILENDDDKLGYHVGQAKDAIWSTYHKRDCFRCPECDGSGYSGELGKTKIPIECSSCVGDGYIRKNLEGA